MKSSVAIESEVEPKVVAFGEPDADEPKVVAFGEEDPSNDEPAVIPFDAGAVSNNDEPEVIPFGAPDPKSEEDERYEMLLAG